MPQNFLELEGLLLQSVDHFDDRIEVKAELAGGVAPPCRCCNRALMPKGKRTSLFYDLPIGFKHLKIFIKRERFICTHCGIEQFATLPILNERRKCTERLLNIIRIKCLTIPFFDLAGYIGIDSAVIKSIALEYTKHLENTVKFQTPKILSINRMVVGDEDRYVITNIEKKTLFNILEAENDSTLKRYLKSLSNRKDVEWVFEDLRMPLREVLHYAFPKSCSVVHKQTVISAINRTIQNECYLRQIILDNKRKDLCKRFIKIATSKVAKELTQTDKRDLADAYAVTPELRFLFELKDELLSIYNYEDAATAKFSLSMWVANIPHSLVVLTSLSKQIQRSMIEIINYWHVPEEVRVNYMECYVHLKHIVSYVRHANNYWKIRARLLYDETARSMNREESVIYGQIEYGASLNWLKERIG